MSNKNGRRKNGEGYPKGPIVYRFLDEFGNILYIGQTRNLKRRVSQHKRKSPFYDETSKFEICKCVSEVDMLVYETLLINHYKPLHNTHVYEGKSSYTVPVLDWVESYLT